MTFLVDLGDVEEGCCNHHLDLMAKAMVEPGAKDESIWALHENPWIRDHIEDVTRRLQNILERIQDTFARLLTGEGMGAMKKSDVPWLRWDENEFRRALEYLQEKNPSDYTLDDWMLVCDWIIQRYLPAGVINTEAEYLTVRAALIGKIEANRARIKAGVNRPEDIVELVPTSFAHVPPRVLSPTERATLDVSKVRAALFINAVSDRTRAAMKNIIVQHVQAQILGQKEGQAQALRQSLFDNFGILNRDFRRIAVTEAGECVNQGFVGAQDLGSKVKRKEAYKGACPFCRSIDGKTFKVVDPAAPDKDGQTDVWLGKTNVGRSAASRMRVGGSLVDRTASEMWWPAAGVQHPHCRGSWLPVSDVPPNVSPEFADWLEGLLKKKGS
jgi:hypothetical protein